MRSAAALLLVATLFGCSRREEPPSVLGAIVVGAVTPKTGPHPDLQLDFDQFAAKHFPDEFRRLPNDIRINLLDADRRVIETTVQPSDARRALTAKVNALKDQMKRGR